MAEDEYEIDLYGDAGNEEGASRNDSNEKSYEKSLNDNTAVKSEDDYDTKGGDAHMEGNTDHDQMSSQQTPNLQGVKRKVGDDRPRDPGATSALMISELNWWNTDDEIRGWAGEAGCEDELKDITFSEHKVNGKCKGQAYVEFTSQHAASGTKHCIEEMGEKNARPGQKRPSITYSSPGINPFRTLPKDAPARQNKDTNRPPSDGGYSRDRNINFSGGPGGGNAFGGGGFRGGRGGFNRGGGGMNQSGYNRNFAGNNFNAYNQNMGFNSGGNFGAGGGFGVGMNRGMMGGMRGGPGGARGGRGCMNGMMGGMGGGMGNMGMGPMAGNMGAGMAGMGLMGGGMPGFQGMPAPFGNPAFSGSWGNNQSNDWGNQNPHGVKRPRGE